MEYKKTLNQIKALLSIQVKLEQMKLEDGVTIVEAESFEPDYSIGIVSETGIVAMPVGEYKTQDGSIILVEQEGIIKEVKPAGAPEAEVPEEVVAPEMEAEQQPKKVVESVSKETFFAKEQELELEKQKSAKLEEELEAIKVQLSAAPAPLVFNPENEKKVEVNLLHSKRPETTESKIYKKLFSKN